MRPVLLLIGMILVGSALVMLLSNKAKDPGNPQVVEHLAGQMLAVNFAHADHTQQRCLACHHNFADDTGIGLCFDCHKSDPDIAADIEPHFHNLCRDCHQQEQLQGRDHGPVRSCIACHTSDDRP